MSYRLPWHCTSSNEAQLGVNPELDLFGGGVDIKAPADPISTKLERLSTEFEPLSTESEHLSTELESLSNDSQLAEDSGEWRKLLTIAAPFKERRRLSSHEDVEGFKVAILALCKDHFLEGGKIATLLARNPDDLRRRFLNPMVDAGLLERRHEHLNAPRQAYKTRISPENIISASAESTRFTEIPSPWTDQTP